MPSAGACRGQVVAEADAVGRAERGQAAVDLADDGDALVGEVEQVDGEHADDDGDERAGNDGRVAPQGHDDDERHDADDQRAGVGVAEVAEEAPQLLEEVALLALDPNSFGTWPMMIVRARPMMKPLSTGSEMKLARKPSRSSPAPSGEQAGHEGEHTGEGEDVVGPAGGQVGDRRRRQRRRRRHRPDDQVARAAEGGVEQQRRRRRVQPDDRRDAGDRRVGQRFGHEHRPHRQPGDHVASQPRRW